MRTIVIGGSGNFGARIVRALCVEPDIDVLIAGRRAGTVPGFPDVAGLVLDIEAPDFAARLQALAPALVINCVGPFQSQDYRVAKAAVAVGAHYVDLADGRRFVADFAAQVNHQAAAAKKLAITGASTLPALSSAVVESLREGLASLRSIEVIIAPGQRAPRGAATLAAVFSYLGRDFPVWCGGRWRRVWGWMDLRRIRLDIGTRLAAACDVPDLELFPARFPGVESVAFHASLEFGLQHLALWCLAALRRLGLALPVTRWATGLNQFAGVFDASAGDKGGMAVSIVGRRVDGGLVRRTWQLTVPAEHGPEIPCMAAILMARRFSRGTLEKVGAFPCVGFLELPDFESEFAQWGIATRVEETPA